MKVSELIKKLSDFDPEAKVFLLDEYGDHVEVEQVFRIKDKEKEESKQDVILTEFF